MTGNVHIDIVKSEMKRIQDAIEVLKGKADGYNFEAEKARIAGDPVRAGKLAGTANAYMLSATIMQGNLDEVTCNLEAWEES